MLAWIEEKRIIKFDPERVRLISMPETDKPLIHVSGHFYVECHAWKYENGKKMGISGEVKFNMVD